MDKDLREAYEKMYKSSGPLRCNIIDFVIKIKEDTLIRVHLDYMYKNSSNTDETDIQVDIRPTGMFNLAEHLRNDILLNNIEKDKVFEMIERIECYYNWLNLTYIPKWGHIEDFFYRVFLWIREDLHAFCIYTGCHMDIIYSFEKDVNWENVATAETEYTRVEHYI